MNLNVFNQVATIGVGLVVAVLISYLITWILVKIKKKLVFLLPILFGLFSAVFWILGLLSDDWSALGFLIYGSLGLIAFVGSCISSVFIFIKHKKRI